MSKILARLVALFIDSQGTKSSRYKSTFKEVAAYSLIFGWGNCRDAVRELIPLLSPVQNIKVKGWASSVTPIFGGGRGMLRSLNRHVWENALCGQFPPVKCSCCTGSWLKILVQVDGGSEMFGGFQSRPHLFKLEDIRAFFFSFK